MYQRSINMPAQQQLVNKKPPSQRSQLEVIGLTVIAMAVILVYASTLTSPFVFDDEHTIKDNIHIRLDNISLDNLLAAAFDSPHPHRPVSNIGFALNYYFHGNNVVGYHATNVIVHLITAILLYFLLKVTLTTPAFKLEPRTISLIAFLSTLIWAIHPVQTQSVSYIVQRMNSQAAMFFLLSMLMYIGFRQSPGRLKSVLFLCGCAASGILALGSKEIAATLPFFILLYEWFFFQDLDSGFPKKFFPALVIVAVLSVAVSLYYLEGNPVERLLAGYAHRDFSPVQRLMTETRVVIFYISLLLFPHPDRLNLDHDYAVSNSLLDPASTLGSLILIAAMMVAAVLLARRHRLLSFSIIWFLGNLVIESTIIGLELIFEHRVYLPSMFIIAAIIEMAVTRLKPRGLVVGVIILAGMVAGVWTYQRNRVWADPELFWRDCIRKSPDKPRPFNNLGIVLARNGQYDEAADAFREAIQRNPKTAKPHYNLASVLVLMERLDEAVEQLKITLARAPANHLAHNNLALIYMRQDRLQEAEVLLRAAIRIKPDYESAYSNLGVLMRRQGKLDEAITLFEKAIDLYPVYAEAHNNLGYALKMKGDIRKAIEHFEKALEITPDYDLARKNLEEARSLTSNSKP